MNKQNFKNGNAMFPISTDALDFMQEQILLVAQLTALAGSRVIVRKPTNGKDGLCIFDGELLPLTGTATGTHIQIAETTTDITARGTTYKDARVVRQAVYTNGDGESVETFVVLDNMLTLKTSIANLNSALETEKITRAQHDVPKGTIIDWYGVCKCDQLPYGFVPCGLFFKGNAESFSPGGAGWQEMEKWKAKYPSISIQSATRDGSNFGIYISNCLGQTVPDLTDRFIVQAGFSYGLSETGGQKNVTLKPENLPPHKHGYVKVLTNGEGGTWLAQGNMADHQVRRGDAYTGADIYDKNGSLVKEGTKTATSFDNRPPFFALYKLIKVI